MKFQCSLLMLIYSKVISFQHIQYIYLTLFVLRCRRQLNYDIVHLYDCYFLRFLLVANLYGTLVCTYAIVLFCGCYRYFYFIIIPYNSHFTASSNTKAKYIVPFYYRIILKHKALLKQNPFILSTPWRHSIQCCGSALVSMMIRIEGFEYQKWKKISVKFILCWSKIAIYLSLGLHKWEKEGRVHPIF